MLKSRIINILVVCILLTISFSNSSYGLTKDEELLDLKNKIDKAYYSFDSNLLRKLLRTSFGYQKKYPDDWRPAYYSGILCFQIGKILYLPDPDKAYNYFDKSIDFLFKVKKSKYSAEIAALISAAYGKKSSLSTIKAIYFGIKAREYIYEANAMDSANVKVYLIAATHLMHTPESFGGDKKWAEELLNKALKMIYKQINKDDNSVEWASEKEIYAYLAQLEILRENKDKAKLYIDKALALCPDYGFVLYDLIPQLKKLD